MDMSSPRFAVVLLLLAVAAMPRAEAAVRRDLSAAAPKQRVRKELRSLTPAEHQMFVVGVSTMLSTSTAAGVKLFGPNYKEYEYFIIKHALSTHDPRGDQGHYGPSLMTFHRALMLEYETSLLSVVPGLLAMPYWNSMLDFASGKYHRKAKSMFSTDYAGAIPANEHTAYQVTDSSFAWRKIGSFNWKKWGKYGHLYNGSQTTGLLRDYSNTNNNTYITRFPAANIPFHPARPDTAFAEVWYTDMAVGQDFNYTQADYERCQNTKLFPTWMEWNWCIDSGTYPPIAILTPDFLSKYTATYSSLLHSFAHLITGGVQAGSLSEGDMCDVATSVNEPWLFMTHHANIDRNAMIWQTKSLAGNATLGLTAVMWEYPATSKEYPYAKNGTFLHDVANAHFAFTDIFPHKPKNATGYTHFEILDYTRPCSAMYTYDQMDA